MEPTSITSLGKRESRIRETVEKASQEKRKLTEFEESQIYPEYANIYQEYSTLALQGDLEALKRAFFIQWFGFIEPKYLTGIDYDLLPKSSVAAILKELDRKIKEKDIDQEMEALLNWGYAVVDFYFDAIEGAPNLKAYLFTVNKNEDTFPKFDLDIMKNRGILGQYYLSISRQRKFKNNWE